MSSKIYIAPVMERIKSNVEDAWKEIPDDAPYNAHANTMIDTVNKEISTFVNKLVEEGEANAFITSALEQFEGLSRGNIAPTIQARMNLATEKQIGVCLVDIVRDTLSEMTVQQLALRGLELEYFSREDDDRIDLTPNSPKNDES